MKILLLAFSLVFLASNLAIGATYEWIDEKGILHIQDRPPKKITPAMKLKKSRSIKSRVQDSTDDASTDKSTSVDEPYDGSILFKLAEKESKKFSSKVELYVTSWCGYCKKAEAYFRSNGIAYKKFDIEKDQAAARRKKRLHNGEGVPLAVVNGTAILGYSPAAYERALKRK